MSLRRSLTPPIMLGIAMIVLLVVLTVGWVFLNVFGALDNAQWAALHWSLLAVGTAFIGLLVVGVALYLVLSVKAIRLNQRQSNFIDSVTHELKSPIAAIKLCLQTLSRRQLSQSEQAHFYQFMLEDLQRLDLLTDHMLDAGRVDAKPVNHSVEAVALDRLLADCADTVCLRYRVPRETVRLDAEPVAVSALRVDLDMIFRNLIDNAVKYAGASPQVEVTLRRDTDGALVVSVGDNGRGIPPKLRRKIYGRFVRLGLELERDRPGTGLGLYIVRTLVRKLRGGIRVRDPEQGSGTVFEVRLPGSLVVPNHGVAATGGAQRIENQVGFM